MPIPTEEELTEFLCSNFFVNFSKIARKFRIKNEAVPDVIKPLIKRNIVFIETVGSNKFVRLKT